MTRENPYQGLYLPLRTRGRPQRPKSHFNFQTAFPFKRGNSNLEQLSLADKITPEQFNTAENFLWLMKKVRKNLPLPRIAKSKYQERIHGNLREIETYPDCFTHEEEVFHWWRLSIIVLKEGGETTKKLIEDFVWDNVPLSSLSEVEIQLIRRGLDRLASLYKERGDNFT